MFICLVVIVEAAPAFGQGRAKNLEDWQHASAQIDIAWNRFEHGDAEGALRVFRKELTILADISSSGRDAVDCQRGIVLAELFARHDANAIAALRTTGIEPKGDSLVFAGRIAEALRAYRDATQDLAMSEPRAPEHDRVVVAGVADALRGDWRRAIIDWSRPAVGGGPYDLTDLQTALVGLAYAQLGEWRSAERAWIAAARVIRNVPDVGDISPGNQMALSMLVHYRAHFARGQNNYSLTTR